MDAARKSLSNAFESWSPVSLGFAIKRSDEMPPIASVNRPLIHCSSDVHQSPSGQSAGNLAGASYRNRTGISKRSPDFVRIESVFVKYRLAPWTGTKHELPANVVRSPTRCL